MTTPSTRRLSEVARHLAYPAGIVTSGWPRVERRLADMAIQYDGWQAGAVQLILARDASDRYVATVGGVTMSIPRQVGKTFTVGSLLVALCLEYPGLRVVWTSHHLRTTTNTFRAMQGMVRRKRVSSQLAHNGIRTANGEQEIRFANGSIIMFGAREHGFGVGIDAIDVLVCDEGQRLSSRALADMMPTTNQARHAHGALPIFIGTPPAPTDMGDEFAARRQKAIDGKMSNGIYIEMSADEDADTDDPEQWAKANPSYPHRTPHESMLRLRENLSDEDDWRRQAMGIWDPPDSHDLVISMPVWSARAADDPPPENTPPTALAVDRWYDGTTSIAGAWQTDDGVHVELLAVDPAADVGQVVEWLVDRAGRRIPVVIAADAPAASLVPDLRARKVKVNTVSSGDLARACGGFVGDVEGERLTHADQQQLNLALAGAKKKPYAKAGAWVWDRQTPDHDISGLVAATLARFGAVIHKKSAGNGKVMVL